jgi:hypothetical protein
MDTVTKRLTSLTSQGVSISSFGEQLAAGVYRLAFVWLRALRVHRLLLL